jgi:hypothetical protein
LLVRVELEDVEDGLWVTSSFLLCDGRRGEQLGPLWRKSSEASRHWVKPDVHLVNKVGGLADAHEWGARVDVFHPAVDLLVGAESEVYQLVLDLDFDAEGLDIDALDINDVDELENEGRRRRLLILEDLKLVHGENKPLLAPQEAPDAFLFDACSAGPDDGADRLIGRHRARVVKDRIRACISTRRVGGGGLLPRRGSRRWWQAGGRSTRSGWRRGGPRWREGGL